MIRLPEIDADQVFSDYKRNLRIGEFGVSQILLFPATDNRFLILQILFYYDHRTW